MKHTPTPWHRNIPPITRYPTIFAGRNTHVLQVVTHATPPDVAEANAEFILRAVNSHDALVAALEELSDAVRLARVSGPHDVPGLVEPHENAVQALRLARGEG